MEYDVITLGSATLDVYAHTEASFITISENHTKKMMIAYPSGSKILINKLNFFVGGGGTNTAVTFARMGLKTAYLGNLGEDDNLHKIIKCLKKDCIDFIGTLSCDQNDYSVILDSQNEDRTILNYKSASEKLKFSKVNKELLNAKLFYFASFTNNAFKEAEKIAMYAKKKGAKIAFNPSSYLAKKGWDYLKNMIKLTDILIMNDEEAEMIIGAGNVIENLKGLQRLGPNIVAVTKGKEGIELFHHGIHYKCEAYKVKVVETTGAGDAFASAFVCSIQKGCDIETSIKIGLANSAAAVSFIGPKDKTLTYSEAKKYIEKHEVVIEKHKV